MIIDLKRPKVSICSVTYNHEDFIAQAIEGVLMQKTNFPIEMIIGEDCSTDNTKVIIENYANKYPSIIKPFFHRENIGGAKNSVYCLNACSGEYIAALEGDDYWTDPYKLQKQVDFLDNNKEFSACFHSVELIDFASGNVLDIWPSNPVDETTVEDLARMNYVPTVSCLFRNRIKETLPDWFSQAPVGDYSLHMVNAKYGKLKYLPDVMAVYRKHSGGAWTGSVVNATHIKLFKTIDFIKREFSSDDRYAIVLENLQMHQYSILGHLLDDLDAVSRQKFFNDYSEELSDLLVGSWKKIYSNNISLQSKGARLGLSIAKKLRNLLGK